MIRTSAPAARQARSVTCQGGWTLRQRAGEQQPRQRGGGIPWRRGRHSMRGSCEGPLRPRATRRAGETLSAAALPAASCGRRAAAACSAPHSGRRHRPRRPAGTPAPQPRPSLPCRRPPARPSRRARPRWPRRCCCPERPRRAPSSACLPSTRTPSAASAGSSATREEPQPAGCCACGGRWRCACCVKRLLREARAA